MISGISMEQKSGNGFGCVADNERYIRTVRYDWLAQSVRQQGDVQNYANRWIWHYNNERLNMEIGGIAPQQKLALVAWNLLLNPVKNGGITVTQLS